MFKWITVLCLIMIGNTVWAASLSCESCGSECESACGTRQFRTCCFNYLRRKRAPDVVKIVPDKQNYEEKPPETPIYVLENLPEPWTRLITDFRPYSLDDSTQIKKIFFEI